MEMLDYDTKTATLISLIAEYNSHKKDRKQRKIYPVFVLTKFDIMNKKILRDMKLPEQYPEMKEQKERRVYAETILQHFFGQTLALLKGGQLKGVSFDDSHYCFSEVFSEFNDDGIPVPKLKQLDGGPGYEIDYSYPEYEGFINHFRAITKDMPDEIKDEQEFTA